MGDDRKHGPAANKGPEGSPAAAKEDAKSRVQQLAKLLGNDEIARRISEGNATRDQMLAFVTERLGVVSELQERELQLTLKNADFQMPRELEAADLARPTRWHDTAKAYELAVQAICRGDLRRGQELIEQAQKVEEETLERLSRLVDTGEAWRAGKVDAGVLAAMVAQTPASGACAEPTDVRKKIEGILAITQTVPDRSTPRRELDPWWTFEEENEDNPDADA